MSLRPYKLFQWTNLVMVYLKKKIRKISLSFYLLYTIHLDHRCDKCFYFIFQVGGKYYNGFIPPESRFTQGQTVEAHLEISANHLGFLQFKVCAYPSRNPSEEVSQDCLDRNTLLIKFVSSNSCIFEAPHKCTHVRFYRRWICFVYLI